MVPLFLHLLFVIFFPLHSGRYWNNISKEASSMIHSVLQAVAYVLYVILRSLMQLTRCRGKFPCSPVYYTYKHVVKASIITRLTVSLLLLTNMLESLLRIWIFYSQYLTTTRSLKVFKVPKSREYLSKYKSKENCSLLGCSTAMTKALTWVEPFHDNICGG